MCSVSAHLGCGSLYRLAAAFLAAALTLSMNCLAAYSPIYCLSSGSIYKAQVELFIVPFLSKEGRTYKPTMIIPFFLQKQKSHCLTGNLSLLCICCQMPRKQNSRLLFTWKSLSSTRTINLGHKVCALLLQKASNQVSCFQSHVWPDKAWVLFCTRVDGSATWLSFSWVKNPIAIATNCNFKCLAFKKNHKFVDDIVVGFLPSLPAWHDC